MVEVKSLSLTLEINMDRPQKLKLVLQSPPVLPLMRLNLTDFKSLHHRDYCISVFTAVLLTIARK